jgi:hypothetical protein
MMVEPTFRGEWGFMSNLWMNGFRTVNELREDVIEGKRAVLVPCPLTATTGTGKTSRNKKIWKNLTTGGII